MSGGSDYKEPSMPVTKTFTTSPGYYVKRGHWATERTAQAFMYHMFALHLTSCSLKTALFEFDQFSSGADKRTVERYLGSVPKLVRYPGANIVRQNLTSSRIAQFHYMNERRTSRKKGVLERLFYIELKERQVEVDTGTVKITKKPESCCGDCDTCKDCTWGVIFHHERFSYFTQQASLVTAIDHQEVKGETSSIDKTCVSSLLEDISLNSVEELEKPCETENSLARMAKHGVSLNVETVERIKEEEVIDSTRTRRSSESERRVSETARNG